MGQKRIIFNKRGSFLIRKFDFRKKHQLLVKIILGRDNEELYDVLQGKSVCYIQVYYHELNQNHLVMPCTQFTALGRCFEENGL